MTDYSDKLKEALAIMDMKPEDLAEHPDDHMHETIDEYVRMVALLSERGYVSTSWTVAPHLMANMRLLNIEIAILRFSDNLMLFLETKFGSPSEDE